MHDRGRNAGGRDGTKRTGLVGNGAESEVRGSVIVTYPRTETEAERKLREAKKLPVPEYSYVGKTTRYLGQRIADHVRSAKRGKRLPISMWMRGQLMRGNGICTKLLENVPSGVDWQERERFWIKHFRSSGANLLNLTDGGEGLHGHKFSQTHKDRIAVALRTGSNFKCEQCGNNFWRKPCAIAKGDCRFCSKPCYFEWQRGKPKRMPKHD